MFEERDDFIAAEDRGYLAVHRPKGERKKTEPRTFDPQAEVMVYLQCLQRLLKAQLKTVEKWFCSNSYEGILKQIWKLAVLHSGLLSMKHRKAYEFGDAGVPVGQASRQPDRQTCDQPGSFRKFLLQVCVTSGEG